MKKESLKAELSQLNFPKDSIIFITINTGAIGYFRKNKSETYNDLIEILSSILDLKKGGIIFAAYTKGSFLLKPTRTFSKRSTSYAGNFINYLIKHKAIYRSQHPFESYIGLGKRAEEVLKSHDSESGPYTIFNSFIEKNNSYYLMIGTWNDGKNAPPSLHHCQELLGLTRKFTFKYFEKIYHQEMKRIFLRKQSGGCSKGGKKLAIELLEKKIAQQFKFGNANSIIIDPTDSFIYTLEKLKKNKKAYVCEDSNCLSCRGNYYNNPLRFVQIILHKLRQKIFR